MLTLTDVLAKLKREDEVSILEILGITSEHIVDRFEDMIEDRLNEIIDRYEEDYDTEEDL